MIDIKKLLEDYSAFRADQISGRYITLSHLEPLLNDLGISCALEVIGDSELGAPIYKVELGNGPKKILMWSQMHGNESTTTKSVFDLLNFLTGESHEAKTILKECTLCILPMVNPDGAIAYTRKNTNDVDLNRDAQDLYQSESRLLKATFNDFKPDFCFNLHDQRTIFGAGNSGKSATVSFLTPAEDQERTVTPRRKVSMELINYMNSELQQLIPGQVGRYDDGFNINCVGDTFQSAGIPTVLFEAGHYQGDYARERTREFIGCALISGLLHISSNAITGAAYEGYFEIPENEKCFVDILLKNVHVIHKNGREEVTDLAIQYEEVLLNGKITLNPKVHSVGNLGKLFGHKTLVFSEKDYRNGQTKTFSLQNDVKLSLNKFNINDDLLINF